VSCDWVAAGMTALRNLCLLRTRCLLFILRSSMHLYL
jgi:hypothetical protein